MSRLPNNFQFSDSSLKAMGYSDEEIADDSHGLNATSNGTADHSEEQESAELEPGVAEVPDPEPAISRIRESDRDLANQDGPVYEGDELISHSRRPAPPQTPEDPTAWIDQDTTELAAAYGINSQQLETFSSQEEFDAYRQMLDQQQSWGPQQFPQLPQQFPNQGWPPYPQQPFPQQGWQQPPQAGWPQQPPSPYNYQQGSAPLGMQHSFMQQPPQTPPPTIPPDGDSSAKDGEGLKDGLIDLDFHRKLYLEQGFEEDYIPVLMKPLEHLRNQQVQFTQMQGQFEQMRQSMLEAAEANRQEAIHNALDRLDPQYYGNSLHANGQPARINQLHAARRFQIYQTTNMLASQMPGVNIESLVLRADAMTSPQRAITARSQQTRNNLVRQAGRVRPVGGPAKNPSARIPEKRRSEEPITRRSQIDDLMNDAELTEAFRDYYSG